MNDSQFYMPKHKYDALKREFSDGAAWIEAAKIEEINLKLQHEVERLREAMKAAIEELTVLMGEDEVRTECFCRICRHLREALAADREE